MLEHDISSLSLNDKDRLELIFEPLHDLSAVALAVSGGTDSLALMLLVAKWGEHRQNTPDISVITVDHGLRKEAVAETQFVAQVAKELGFSVQIVKGEIQNPGTRLQEKARELRYTLLAQTMTELNLEHVVTAHHAQDQAETMFMRLARGTGLTGLGAMSKRSIGYGKTILRPLLEIEKSALEAIVSQSNYDAAEDPSNGDEKFERVRWRKALSSLRNEGLSSEMLVLSASRLRRADDALNVIVERLYEELFVIDPFGCIYFSLKAIQQQTSEIAIRLLMRALDDAGGETASPSLVQVEALNTHFQTGIVGFKATTIGGCAVCAKDGLGQIYREVGRTSSAEVNVEPGHSTIWDQRFRIFSASDFPSSLRVVPATSLTRNKLDELLPNIPNVAMKAVQSSPMITASGKVLAVGEHVFVDGVEVFRTFGPNALI